MSEKNPVIFLSFPRSGCKCVTDILRCTGMNIPKETPALTALYDQFCKDVLGLTNLSMLYKSVASSAFKEAVRGGFKQDLRTAIEKDFIDVERNSLFGFAEHRNILFADALLEAYPEATLVLVIRHPGDCVQSLQAVTPQGELNTSAIIGAWVAAHDGVFPYLTNKRMPVFRTHRLIREPSLLPLHFRSLGRQGLQPFTSFNPEEELLKNCCSIINEEDWHYREDQWCGEQAEKLWLQLALEAVEKLS